MIRLIFLFLSSLAIVSVIYLLSSKPEFVWRAESRVQSYLTSEYGPVICRSVQNKDNNWELDCLKAETGRVFLYAVYPANQAPYPVSRPFYIEAISEDAKESANTGLMKYLQINVAND